MSTFGAEFKLSAMTAQDGVKIIGEAMDNAGSSVSSAGDLNGDGFDDLIVGADGASPNGISSGAAYVVFGTAGGFDPNLNLSTLTGTAGFRISGETQGDQAGWSVSSSGDVNGDGFADLIVGAYGANPNGTDSGAAYVVFGKAGGFDPNLNLSTLTSTTGFQISGEAAFDNAGYSVSSAGDVNGDGFDDVIVGAVGADPNGSSSGAAWVVFGKAGGFGTTLDLSALNGTTGFQISGEAAGDRAGVSVSSAGDVNGDGYDDIIIGSSYSGAAYVVFGMAGGFAATLNLSTLNGTTGFQISGIATGEHQGYAVSDAGDVNGDGFDDLIVGTLYAAGSGAAYVVFGKAGGFGANLNLSTLNGTTGFRISGEVGDQAGTSVSAAGDVNGDGYGDLIVGAPRTDLDGSYNAGAAYVVFGKAGGFSATLNLSTLNGTNGFQISGEESLDLVGISVSSAGDVNDDGFDDLIVGAPGDETNGFHSGAAYIIYGKQTAPTSGADTLTGTNAKDTILGIAGDDVLSGRDGDDRLDGGAGADRLTGGRGNDTYVTDGEDTIIEEAGEGTDTVRASGNVILSANVEHLILTGSGAISGTGNAGANSLTGNGGANTLAGMEGNDTLDGGGGADRLIGGAGDDTYIAGAGDVIVEQSGQGNDTVLAATSVTLARHVESLTLTGSRAINGTGNDGANTITGNSGANTLDGGGGADRLIGGSGRDLVIGGDGTDRLSGGDGNDTLDGGKGADSLIGGRGDDLLGGEAGNDRLDGGPGNDILFGLKGQDVMTGGAGRDGFVFDTRPSAGNVDRITDFRVADDGLLLEGSIFTGIVVRGPGFIRISQEAFVKNTSGRAQDSSDRIIYESDTGRLYYDRDGTGSSKRQHFATLDRNLDLGSDNILVFFY